MKEQRTVRFNYFQLLTMEVILYNSPLKTAGVNILPGLPMDGMWHSAQGKRAK
jgi:hypothetical protein